MDLNFTVLPTDKKDNLNCVYSIKLSPENAEEYIEYLRSVGRLDEAAVRLGAVVNDESFVSKEGKSNYQVRVPSLKQAASGLVFSI